MRITHFGTTYYVATEGQLRLLLGSLKTLQVLAHYDRSGDGT
jgi:hypothetical protein